VWKWIGFAGSAKRFSHEFLARDDPPRILRKELEYLEFLMCELDSLAVETGYHSLEVQANPVKSD